MKLRKDKWHYKIAYGMEHPSERPNKKSLCRYFWRTVVMIPCWPFIWIAKFIVATIATLMILVFAFIYQAITLLIIPIALALGYYPNVKEKTVEFFFLFYSIKEAPSIWWYILIRSFTQHFKIGEEREKEEENEDKKEEDQKSFLEIPLIPKYNGKPVSSVIVPIIMVVYIIYQIVLLIINTMSNLGPTGNSGIFSNNLTILIGVILFILLALMIIGQIRRSEGWYLVKSFIKAKFNKVCPEIEFIDSEDS